MTHSLRFALGLFTVALVAAGCTPRTVEVSMLTRPARASQLDALNVFVGSWTWEAEMLNAAPGIRQWTGTASWSWSLDQRCLKGELSSHTGETNFSSSGMWGWDGRAGRYVWSMYNDWGHPQQGTASYNPSTQRWVMPYRSIGLDGTASHGRYLMTVVNNDTLEWEMEEWADGLHLFKKTEMKGTYRRVKP